MTSTRPIRTRADLLELGQGQDAWRFLSMAVPALEKHREDHDLRLLICANACALGLPTLARDVLSELPQPLQTDPVAGQIVMLIESLPQDCLEYELLSTRVTRIADTMRARGVGFSDDALETTLRGLRRLTVLRATDCNVIRRTEDTAWFPLCDARRAVWNAPLGYLHADGAVDSGKVPRGIVLDAIDPPWMLERLAQTLPVQPDGFQTPIIVVQENTQDLLTALALLDDGEEIARDARCVWIVGPESIRRLRDYLATRLDYSLPDSLFRSGVPTPGIEEAMREAVTAQQHEHRRLKNQVDRVYAGLDGGHWAERFSTAQSSEAVLRIVLPVSRYSTFVHHAAEDLREALLSLGHEVVILDEPDQYTRLASPAYLRLFAEWCPDLVVSINHPRQQFGEVCPVNVPVLTWIQDQMQHLYRRELGAAQGRLDFLAGVVSQTLFRDFGFPRNQALVLPVVASSRKFHDAAVSASNHARFGCEIAYVSHNSQPPHDLHQSLLRAIPIGSPLRQSLTDLPDRIGELLSGGLATPLSSELRRLAEDVFDRAGVHPDPSAVTTMHHQWILPLAERMLRHEMLGWAAELSEERGWKLRIHGRGWEQHPTLAKFGEGPIEHGEALRASYAAARVHLHASCVATVHQRVIECTLSTGFPACRITGSDISVLDSIACSSLTGHAPEASYALWRQPVIFTSNHAHLMMHMAQRQGLGLPAWQWICLMNEHRDPDRPYAISKEFSPAWLLGDLSEMTFWDRPSFERLMDRVITDEDFRRSGGDAMRRRALTHLTHDVFSKRLLDFIASRLNP